MKIGFVLDDTIDKPDGVQQYVLTLGSWLSAHGHTVHYLAGASQRQDVGPVHSLSKNVRVKFNGNWLSIPLPANSRVVRELLQRERYDVLHIQMPYSPMLAHKVVRLARPTTAVVGTFHILPQTSLVRVATHALGRWTRTSLRRFDRVFAVSPAARDFAAQAFKLADIQVLPNVVELERFQRGMPVAALRQGPPVIMFLGRLVPRKGCTHLLEALAILKHNHPEQPFQAVICGKGPLDAQLKARAERLGISQDVRFTGFLSEADKPGYIASADVIVFPSTGGESFGIVLIEAMATGRPVVLAGDNPGYRSVMYEQPELLFKPQSHQALASRLFIYLSDAAARQPKISWQNKHVRQFDIETVGPQLLSAYGAVHQRLQNKARP